MRIVPKPLHLAKAQRSRIQTAKMGWHNVGSKKAYFRSNWEYRYACYLEFLKICGVITEWLHEPQTFWFEKIKRGTRSYLPDFKVIRPNGSHYWVEVKGYFDRKSLTKIKRFKKYFPQEELIIVDKDWFTKNKGAIPHEQSIPRTSLESTQAPLPSG